MGVAGAVRGRLTTPVAISPHLREDGNVTRSGPEAERYDRAEYQRRRELRDLRHRYVDERVKGSRQSWKSFLKERRPR